ncbi:MAG: Gfo/Idh/MocA family oxidoreductase [Chitinophagaceae bacterium]|nr:Gfo/Idh/MocA family oxidoreductase [Chitinophagaceae bacterium]
MRRREFLEKGSWILGGMAFADKLSFAPSQPLKVAIIGCGDRGLGIMEMMQEFPNYFNVTTACDLLDFRLDQAKKSKGSTAVKTVRDYRQVMDDRSIDAVVIATSLDAHFPVAASALQAGKHIYLEKAMTWSIEEATQLVQLAKQYPKSTLLVGHQYRYTPLYFKVKEMIQSEYLGNVTQIDCRWDRNGSWRRNVPAGYSDEQVNWRMYRKYSGGLAAELLSHQIDFINWAFQTNPDSIMGYGGIDHYKDGRETYDNIQVILRYDKKGMIGNFGATCGNAHEGYNFKIKGTRGTVLLLPHKGVFYPEKEIKKELQTVDGVTGATRLEWNQDGGINIMNEPMKDGTWYALREFYNSIKEGKQPVSNVLTGATTAVCVHLANDAIYNRTIKNWKEDYNFK